MGGNNDPLFIFFWLKDTEFGFPERSGMIHAKHVGNLTMYSNASEKGFHLQESGSGQLLQKSAGWTFLSLPDLIF